jgi:hypothetical protein
VRMTQMQAPTALAGAAHAVNPEKPAEFEAAVRPFHAEHLRR